MHQLAHFTHKSLGKRTWKCAHRGTSAGNVHFLPLHPLYCGIPCVISHCRPRDPIYVLLCPFTTHLPSIYRPYTVLFQKSISWVAFISLAYPFTVPFRSICCSFPLDPFFLPLFSVFDLFLVSLSSLFGPFNIFGKYYHLYS